MVTSISEWDPAADIEQKPENTGSVNTGNLVNILRENTFNPELRDLVGRIKGNESIDTPADVKVTETVKEPEHTDVAEEIVDPNDIDGISENELLFKLHELFYKVKNLPESNEINSSFNPFHEKNTGREYSENFLHHINQIINSLIPSSFAILPFDINSKCFLVNYSNIENINAENIIINMRDKLYDNIIYGQYGIILNNSSIIEDQALMKKFSTSDNSTCSYYFIHTCKLTEHFYNDISSRPNKMLTDSLSPVLMIQFDDNSNITAEKIYKLLIERLSALLFIIDENQYARIHFEFFESLNYDILTIDYLLQICIKSNRNSGIIIKLNNKYDKKLLILMKYIYSKLLKVFSGNSFLIRIRIDEIAIITSKTMLESTLKIINEYNRLFSNSFGISIFSISKSGDLEMLLKKLYL